MNFIVPVAFMRRAVEMVIGESRICTKEASAAGTRMSEMRESIVYGAVRSGNW